MRKHLALILALGLLAWMNLAIAQEEKAPLPELPVKGMVTMIDLGADFCLSCQRMVPILKELKEEYKGRAAVVAIDLLQHREQAEKYQIRTVPTQIFFDKNGKEVFRHEGFLSKKRFADYMAKMGVR